MGVVLHCSCYAPFRFSYENGTFTVENRFDFTDFSECKLKYEIICDDETVCKGEKKISVAPHEKGSFSVNAKLPKKCKLGCFANLELIKDGKSLSLLQQEIDLEKEKQIYSASPADMTENEFQIIAKGENFQYTFDKAKGNLCSMIIDGKERLANPVKLTAVRAYTDNDGREMQKKWYNVGMNMSEYIDQAFTHVYDCSLNNNKIVFNSSLAGPGRLPFFCYCVAFTVTMDGRIEIELDGKVREDCEWLPRLGFEFELAKKNASFEYYGRVRTLTNSINKELIQFIPLLVNIGQLR